MVKVKRLIVSGMMALILASCSGLGGEPVVVGTVPPAATTIADVGYPAQPPDVARGATIYAENCIKCHGADGRGDGELVQSGQVTNPGNFRDSASAREQYPRQWFDTITNGNLEKLMPPWKDALTEQERWDVAMYTYTMHYTADQLALGEILFQDCAECHGAGGRGDGPEAAKNKGRVKNLTNQQSLSTLEDKAIYNMVVEGSTDEMPAYGDKFNEEERWAVVAYARTLSLTNAVQVITNTAVTTGSQVDQTPTVEAPIPATPEISVPTGSATITGAVTNGTVDGIVPNGLTVMLQVFQPDATPLTDLTQTTSLAADGTFRFENVPVDADKVYLTVVNYNGRNFVSGVFQGDPLLTSFEMPITIYELTADPAVIKMTAAVAQTEVISDRIEVQYAVRFENTSDRVFSSDTPEADGRYKSVYLTLPPGALVIGIADEPRYITSEDGLTVWDTVPLVPGEERYMIVSYLLSYGGGAVIEYPLPFAFDGQLRVLIRPDTVSLTSPQLISIGVQQLGDLEYQGYGLDSVLPVNTIIQYELSGEAGDAAVVEQPSSTLSASVLIPLVGLLVGLVILVIGGFMLLTARRSDSKPGSKIDQDRLIDSLIQQIAELDAQHNAGQINHDVYRHRREQLKARLAALMDQHNTEG